MSKTQSRAVELASKHPSDAGRFDKVSRALIRQLIDRESWVGDSSIARKFYEETTVEISPELVRDVRRSGL